VKAEDLNGRVIVEFYVEADGSVDNVSIVQSLHPLVDAEMVRVVSAMPTWAPGIDSLGQPTQTKYQMPYSFGVKPAR
jgi:TonB family protein